MAVKRITSAGLQGRLHVLEKRENTFLTIEVENEGGDGANVIFKAALIKICTLKVDQMIVCHVNEVTCQDKKISPNSATPISTIEHFSLF